MSSRKRRGEAMLLAAGGTLPTIRESPAGTPLSPKKSSVGAKRRLSSPISDPPADAEQKPTEALPEKLQLLNKIYEAMLTGRALLKRRSEKITMKTLAPTVEACTGRQFKVEYVQQIKQLYPEAFNWQYIRVPIDPGKPNKLEYVLLLRFDTGAQQAARANSPAGPAGSDKSVPAVPVSNTRFNDAAGRQAFKARVEAYAEAAKKDESEVPDVPLADLPDQDEKCLLIDGSPASSMGRAGSIQRTYSAASPNSGSTARNLRGKMNESPTSKMVQSAFQAAAATCGPSPTGDPSAKTGGANRKLMIDIEMAGELDDEAADTATTPAAKRRRLGFQSNMDTSPGPSMGSPPPSEMKREVPQTPSGSMGRPPLGPSNSLRSPMLARMLSVESMRMLEKSDSEKLASPMTRALQEKKHTSSMLPNAFDLLRAIFGTSGPCAKPRDELATLMCEMTTHRSGISFPEALLQLQLLAQVAPEFLTLEASTPRRQVSGSSPSKPPISSKPMTARICRSVDAGPLRKKLVAYAADVATETPAGPPAGPEDSEKSPGPGPQHAVPGAPPSRRASGQLTPTKHAA